MLKARDAAETRTVSCIVSSKEELTIPHSSVEKFGSDRSFSGKRGDEKRLQASCNVTIRSG